MPRKKHKKIDWNASPPPVNIEFEQAMAKAWSELGFETCAIRRHFKPKYQRTRNSANG
jgi:hypothetical protein